MTFSNGFLDFAPVLSCESKNGGCARNDGGVCRARNYGAADKKA